MTTLSTIETYFTNILNRAPVGDEATGWANLVDQGVQTLDQVRIAFVTSPEVHARVTPVVEMYAADLGRAPDQAGLAYWVSLEDSGALTLAQIGADIAGSPESVAIYGTTVDETFLNKLYQNALGRAPEDGVLATWVASGLTTAQIEAFVATSPEALVHNFNAINTYLDTADAQGNSAPPQGGSLVPAQVAPTFTLTPSMLVVNDGQTVTIALTTTGVAAGTQLAYTIKGISADELVGGALTGVLTVDASGSASVALALKPDTSVKPDETITLSLDNAQAVTNVTVHDTFVAPPAFALTTGADVITPTVNNTAINPTNFPSAANDTFTGTVAPSGSTLNSGDNLDGGGGANVLNITDTAGTGTDDLAGVTLANIQTVSVANASGTTVAADFAQVPTVTKIIAFNTAAGGTDTLTSLATGTAVVASGTDTGTTSIVNIAMADPIDPVSMGVDGGVSGVGFNNDFGREAAATISSTGSSNGTVTAPDTFGLDGGAGTLSTLTVNATTNLVAALFASDYSPTAALTVSGAATSVDLLPDTPIFASIDASGLTAGGLTITTGPELTSLTGGGGDDVITLGGDTTGATVTGGAGGMDSFAGGGGNNTFVFMAAPGAGNLTTIADFASGSDSLDLSKTAFSALTEATGAPLSAADFLSAANAAALPGGSVGAATNSNAIVYLQDTGALYYNADGATAGGLTQIGALGANPLVLADIKVTA